MPNYSTYKALSTGFSKLFDMRGAPLFALALTAFFCGCSSAPLFVWASGDNPRSFTCSVLAETTHAIKIGNVLLVAVGGVTTNSNISPAFTLRDNANNAYSLIESYVTTGPTTQMEARYLFWTTVVSAPKNWTWCANTTMKRGEILLTEYQGVSGVDSSSLLFNLLSPPAGTYQGAPVSASCRDALLFEYVTSVSASISPAGSLTRRDNSGDSIVADAIITSVGNYTASFTTDGLGPTFIIISAVMKGVTCPQSVPSCPSPCVSIVSANVPSGQTVQVSGSALLTSPQVDGALIVSGNLTVAAASQLSATSTVQVGGTTIIQSPVAVVQGSQLFVNGTLILTPEAVFTPVITVIAPSVTVIIANRFQAVIGTPVFASAQLSATLPFGQCAALSDPMANLGATSLSVTVNIAVSSCVAATTSGASSSPSDTVAPSTLSTAAIIGIAVGGGVVVVAVIVTIVAVITVKKRNKKAWKDIDQALEQNQNVVD